LIDHQIKNSLVNTLQIEAATLSNLALSIDDSTVAAIKTLYHAHGKIVVTGVGKSAVIGQKFVATLISTGTQAVFLNAVDALHGDLGIIHTDDIVVCISKSGDTTELISILPLIRSMNIDIVAIVSTLSSPVAKYATHCIHVPIDREADPNNLAPTTSTTAHLAMTDAIAVALLTLKGFTSDDFAKLHPGGNLGKQLYAKVKDLCHVDQVPSVQPQSTLQEVIVSISTGRLGATAVIKDGLLMGIITDGDLRRMLARPDFSLDKKAQDIMSYHPKTIEADSLATEAMSLMKEKSITQLLVVDKGKYIGIIHIHDLIKEGIS
jgi:arabinose-5-phosphate isomerase